MDFGDSFKPNSTRKHLQQQVEEQSRVCDVTVKYGTWMKRYHLHVLMESPFFEHAFKHRYQEQTYGAVELHVGSPTTIDMALMFLYGKSPILSMNNIAEFMELAEFLLLPNMKRLCINWLQTEELSESNVVKILHLCSMYEFNIEHVYDFIEPRLLTLLRCDDMMTLSPESIAILFSDERLSYVPLDLRIDFITRWIDHRKTSRTDEVRKLMALIDLPQMKIEQERLAKQKRLCLITLFHSQTDIVNRMRHDLNPFLQFSKLHAYCFNTQKCINLRLHTSLRISRNTSVHVDGSKVMYYNDKEKCLYGQDLEQRKSWCSAVEYDDPTRELIWKKSIVEHNACYFILTNRNFINTISIQIGQLTYNSDAIHLSTVFVCKGYFIDGCVNSSNMIAIVAVTDDYKLTLNIYNTKSSKTYDGTHLTDFTWANYSLNAQVFGIDNEFSIVEGNSIKIIRFQQDSDIEVQFAKIKVDGTIEFKFAFIGDTIYRLSRKVRNLEFIELIRFLEQRPAPTEWRSITFPQILLPFHADESLFRNLACMSIPMTSPFCHFECPHCQLLDKGCTEQHGLLWN